MPPPSPDSEKLRRPHPLAVRLINELPPHAHVIEIGSGHGRNTDAMRAAGFAVEAIPDSDAPRVQTQRDFFDAALSTHAFLHGLPEDIARMVAAAAHALKNGAPLFCTFASVSDARFGRGRRLGPGVYAAVDGDEANVPHTYFDRTQVVALLEPLFTIDALVETRVDAIVGTWAHARPTGSVHWFVQARKRADQ